ncbi:MAG: hypothetical protein K0R82_57 [Flavipsychrobacter sp.]|jgi:hypothetical protein|nr:hypothetical protein [Flavipsychrobacter sp.]
MKNFYLFIAFLSISVSALAKGEYQAMITVGPVVNGKIPHFANQVISNTGGGTSPAKVSLRLTGRTYATFTAGAFVPIDSYYYRYDNDRGGVLNNNNIDNDETLMYTESIHYMFDKTSATFNNYLRRLQDYYPNDQVKLLTYQPWKASQSMWKDSARYGYTYTADGKMDESTFEQYYANMWTNAVVSDIKYSGQLVTMESPVYKVAFAYDNNVKLVEMIDEQMVNGVWQYKEKHNYEYTGSNVSKHLFYEWNAQSSTWVYKKSWQYTYAGNDLISEIEQDWAGTGWVNVGKHEYTYDANHNMVADVKSIWNAGLGAFAASSKEVWEYNGQNLPTVITTNTWNGTAWAQAENDKQYRLYYENFFPSSVPGLAENSGLSLYPVPATEMLNVSLELNRAEDILLALYDVKGVIVHNARYASVKDLNAAIPVAALPAGTYFLRAAGSSTNITRPVVVHH